MARSCSGSVTLLAAVAIASTHIPLSAQTFAQSPEGLQTSVDRLLDVPQFENATWGVQVVNLVSGEVLYERNARKSFVPASNMKLYTSAAALSQLGPGFTYETRLYAFGRVVDSVLYGHLVVRGSGDPTIGGRYNDGDLTATFRDWADSLRDHGIARINGDIIGDDDVFDDVGLGVGWNWDDETYWYSAEVGGLVFNDNCVDVTITGTSPGRAGEVTWAPGMTDYVD
ncbi:MAG TPA: D-alanyl-D-alanine carboxypeptidase/D-alanyl-D-alanine-endopeptidase, partial [Rhodothermales bacterium]|nr:D-alanyl-D-alanine carboxypeptidase/D-alanyl-D-alanine-endopeptidase [Rhodothermales bacterium]